MDNLEGSRDRLTSAMTCHSLGLFDFRMLPQAISLIEHPKGTFYIPLTNIS